MAKMTEAHVQLAGRIFESMGAFRRAREREAATAGAPLPPDQPELTAGLVCGFARAYRRIEGLERQQVPRAIRYLGRSKPEYAGVTDRLLGDLGNESISVWSDFAESLVEAVERSDDRAATLREFAALIRLEAVDEGGFDFDPDLDLATPATHVRDRPREPVRRLH